MAADKAKELVAQADRAFVAEEFDEATQLYTQAIESWGSKQGAGLAEVYLARSQSHLKQDEHLEAAEDAKHAVALAALGSKTHRLGMLRRGAALFEMEEYEAARDVFQEGTQAYPDNLMLRTWLRKCKVELDEPLEEEPPAAKSPGTAAVAGNSRPTASSLSTAAATGTAAKAATTATTAIAGKPPAAATAGPSNSTAAVPDATAPISKAAPPPFEGYRHQWYQLQNKITVDVYAKGLSKDQVEVSFQEQRLTVAVHVPSTPDWTLDVELYDKVDPAACRFEILRSKVEITLAKANSVQWASLEKSSQVAAPNYSNPAAPPVAGVYPSSYVKNPKDWSKVEAEVKEAESKGELEDGDPLNNFFKKIFSQGDEDQRRAMMKSFVESNGTVLSTNWQEVGSKHVDCTPPDGMQVKKWNQP